MADDHERQSDDADGGSDGGATPSPGGGPERVVSETSVDDILDSIQSEPEDEPDPSPDRVGGGTEDAPEDEAGDRGGERDASDAAPDPSESADDEDGPDVGDGSGGDLAERVEHGTVTGADVRAAEAGEGRDPTPEIDDVDLSIDDLDASPTGGATDPADSTGADDGGDRPGASDRGGLLARLKRLFSR